MIIDSKFYFYGVCLQNKVSSGILWHLYTRSKCTGLRLILFDKFVERPKGVFAIENEIEIDSVLLYIYPIMDCNVHKIGKRQ